jgi:hypothetical protein
MRVSLSRTLASRRPSKVRNSALEPCGRSTDGGLPEAMAMTSIPSKTMPVLVRCMILAALLSTACTPATGPPQSAAPVLTGATAVPATSAPASSVPAAALNAWAPAPRTKTGGCSSANGLPDPACTPGAVDPRVTQANLVTTICRSGYTATVRPPLSVTEPIKRERMAAYGLAGQPLAAEELDHLIALEVGGASQDVANLWPESWTGDANAHMKDAVENFLNREVCRGTIPLAEAQREIATDWLSVYRARGLASAH